MFINASDKTKTDAELASPIMYRDCRRSEKIALSVKQPKMNAVERMAVGNMLVSM